MYHYAFYGYLAYKAYEYSSIIHYALLIVKRVYRWVQPVEKEPDNSEYLDLFLIIDSKDD
jgi:hypothetical protein